MLENHSDHSKIGIESARRGVVPNDAVLDKLIRRYFGSIPDWQQENDIMPICTIISAWALAHITLYEALPMARLESVCERNYVDVTAVLHRISHNNGVVFVAKSDPNMTKPTKRTDGDRLVLKGRIQKGAHPILIPDTILDASMNFEERAHFLIDAYGLDRTFNHARKPLFCDPSNDELSDFYVSKVDPHQDISLNICWVSLAVFYASPRKRSQIRGLAVFVLEELYHSMCDSKNPIHSKHPAFNFERFKSDLDREWDWESSFGDYVREDP